MIDSHDRNLGCLLGLAVGDALGTTLEFSPLGSVTPIEDMVGGGPFHLKPGEWADDTSMALCLAESLIERNVFDPIDQLDRYVRWWCKGHLSSNGRTLRHLGTTPPRRRSAVQSVEMAAGFSTMGDRWRSDRRSVL